MRKLLILIALLAVFTLPVNALDITAPEVPHHIADIMPDSPETFADGLRDLIKAIIAKLRPELIDASKTCLSLFAATLLISMLRPINGNLGKKTVELVCSLWIAVLLLQPTRSLINLGVETVNEMTEYGKLLLPVMTTALAAQGGITKSAALYAGTAMFSTVLSSFICTMLIPMIYIFLAVSIANSAVGEEILKKLRGFVKWITVWILKLGLYCFTGYMGLTGVISGTTDAAALKATKLAISSAVPVIGGILSDASETVLLSAGMVKNAAGIYGLLAILAICLGPFVSIGIQHLLLKLTGAVCAVFAPKQASDLITDFSAAMGLLLAATGTICLMLLISTVCYMKGVA